MGLEPRLWGDALTNPTSSLILVGQDGSGASSTKRLDVLVLNKGLETGNKAIVGAKTAAGTLSLDGSEGNDGKVLVNALGGNVDIGSSSNTTTDETLKVETGKANGLAIFSRKNDVQEWQVYVSAADKYVVFDALNSKFPLVIESNSPNDSIVVESTGDVGFGTNAPDAGIHVLVGGTVTTQGAADTAAIFQNSTAAGTTCDVFILSGSTGLAELWLGHSTSALEAGLILHNNTDVLDVFSSGEILMDTTRVSFNGLVNLNQTSSTGDPTTTQYPNDGDVGVHHNTTSGDRTFAWNDGGTIFKVTMT